MAVLCLYGCGAPQPASISQQQVQAALTQPMQARLSVNTADFAAEGVFERTGPGMYSFAVTLPQQLEGLTFRADQQECTVSYKGMELKLQSDLLPAGFAVKTLNCALDEMMRQDGTALQNTADGGGILSGKTEGHSFELRLTNQCVPVSFSVPEYDLEIAWLNETE